MSRIDNMAEIQRLVSERVEEERREQEPASMPDYDKRTAAVEELNQIHAVIMIGGTCRILNEFTDPTWNRPEINFSTVNDFYNRYSNRKIMVPGKRKGNLEETTIAKVWMESRDRREFHGLVFDPSNKANGQYYNLWKGFAIEPIEGDWSLMDKHILEVICSGNEEIYRWVSAWMARIVQDPGGDRPGTSIVLKGLQGCGKGIFASTFGFLFGNHFLHLNSQNQLSGRFNSHFKDCLVCFLDEAVWGGNKDAEGTLKALVTEKTLNIEAKGKDIIPLKNHVNIIIASNNDWIVPAGLEERRFCVLEVSPRYKQNKEYFGKLQDQMDTGGRAAMLYSLMHHDYSGIDLRTIPRTEALLDQIIHSMSSVKKFWFEILQNGCWPFSETWESRIDCEKIYKEYVAFANNLREKTPVADSQFGKELRNLCPSISRKRGSGEGRPWQYDFPPIDECRKQFEQAVNMTLKWDEEEN